MTAGEEIQAGQPVYLGEDGYVLTTAPSMNAMPMGLAMSFATWYRPVSVVQHGRVSYERQPCEACKGDGYTPKQTVGFAAYSQVDFSSLTVTRFDEDGRRITEYQRATPENPVLNFADLSFDERMAIATRERQWRMTDTFAFRNPSPEEIAEHERQQTYPRLP